MNQKVLTVYERKDLKKNAMNRLRSKGMIPAVVYGYHGNKNISLNHKDFTTNFKTISESTIIKLKYGTEELEVFVKDYQKDILSGLIRHIDFYEIERGKALRTHVPMKFTGNPVGVREGGLLEHKIEEVEVECLPKDLPEEIVVDLADLKIGDSIHIRDLDVPEGVKILITGDQTVAVVTHAKAEKVEEPEEGLEEEAEEQEETEE